MSQPPQQIQSNSRWCSAIKHSDICNHIKKGILVIAIATETIALIGCVFWILALNGVNLGALNSIATMAMVGKEYILIGFFAGAIGILAALTCSQDITLKANEFACFDLKNEDKTVFNLKFKVSPMLEFSMNFKTSDERKQYIQNWLSDFTESPYSATFRSAE